MTERLRAAQETVDTRQGSVDARYRPELHACAPVGWLNDPNGFGYFGGKAHLFYQYHPYSSAWGPMHWGHWTSEDLVHWRDEPVALAPDAPFDALGCFSGTALEAEGKLVLAYTGVCVGKPGEPPLQQQCIAESEDGVTFTKWADNPVIRAEQLPAGASAVDFRDPKLQSVPGGYRLVMASRGQSGGELLAFTSPDLRRWSYAGTLARGLGEMCECPDVFTLDGRTVILTSLIGNHDPQLPGPQPAVYLTGREAEGCFHADAPMQALDWGPDFYAPQTMAMPDGRRILTAWANSWQTVMPTHTLGHGWAGMMTLARECSLRGNQLCQQPVAELGAMRRGERRMAPMGIPERRPIPEWAGAGREILLTVDVRAAQTLTLWLMQTGDESLTLTWDRARGTLRADRSACGYPPTADGSPEEKPDAEAPATLRDGVLRLRVFVDRSIVEVFIGQGEATLTMLAFPKGEEYGVSLGASGDAQVLEGVSWKLGR